MQGPEGHMKGQGRGKMGRVVDGLEKRGRGKKQGGGREGRGGRETPSHKPNVLADQQRTAGP